MSNNGLTKLVEELSELVVVAAKRIAYPNDLYHPDGSNQRERLQDEMGDVLAIIEYVRNTQALNLAQIQARQATKLRLYRQWADE